MTLLSRGRGWTVIKDAGGLEGGERGGQSKGGETGAAGGTGKSKWGGDQGGNDAAGGGSKETSMLPLEQCSVTAYRWDIEVQRSFRVLGTSHESHF